jgi:hypothetical protein
VGNAWKILPITAPSLWCLSVCGDKQGKVAKVVTAGDMHLIKQKYNFFKIIFIIENI